jgi:hypothetical protein
MTPLRRTERSERPVNPVRVVPGTATSRLNSRSAAETPGGASTDLSVPTTGSFASTCQWSARRIVGPSQGDELMVHCIDYTSVSPFW